MELALFVYELTKKFPKEEMFGIVSQMKRATVSIPSNIAEGSRRGTRKDFRHFLMNAYGSGAELETQLKLSEKLLFGVASDYVKINTLLSEVMKMLNVMIKNLEKE